MSLFHYFPTLLNALFLPLILSTDCLSRVIKRDEPKGSIPLAYFISDFLIVLSVCVPVFKEPRSTLFQISSTKDSSVFNQSRRSRIIKRCVSLPLDLCATTSTSLLCLSYRHARLARHYPEFVHRTILRVLKDVDEIVLACTNIHNCQKEVLQWSVQKI